MTGRVDTEGLSRAEAASLLAWWVEVGVDATVQEEPRDWRVSKALPRAADAGGEELFRASPEDSVLPSRPFSGSAEIDTLTAFHAWLAESADLPLFRAGAARALPHGPAEAEVMLVAGLPAPEDAAEGRPIGGEAWALTVRMLAAIGLTPEQAYVAALTCFSGSGTRFTDAETAACRETVLRQITLAAPKRLLLLGDAPVKLLLGQPMAAARGKLHHVAGTPTVATFAPRYLLAHPDHKKHAWADLLLLMGNDR